MHVIKKMFKGITLISLLLLLVFHGGSEVIKNHINLEEIQKVEGKLQLELLYEWSSEDETDENKIFYEPKDIAFNEKGELFILEANRIKVFDKSRKLIRIIGGAGQGPGDFFDPGYLEFDKEENIVVIERGNLR